MTDAEHRWRPKRSRHEHAPPRESRNSHSPDCPYWRQYDHQTCPCCQGEARARKDDQQ